MLPLPIFCPRRWAHPFGRRADQSGGRKGQSGRRADHSARGFGELDGLIRLPKRADLSPRGLVKLINRPGELISSHGGRPPGELISPAGEVISSPGGLISSPGKLRRSPVELISRGVSLPGELIQQKQKPGLAGKRSPQNLSKLQEHVGRICLRILCAHFQLQRRRAICVCRFSRATCSSPYNSSCLRGGGEDRSCLRILLVQASLY